MLHRNICITWIGIPIVCIYLFYLYPVLTGTFIRGDEDGNEVTPRPISILKLINDLQWTSIVIIYDVYQDVEVPKNIQQQWYDLNVANLRDILSTVSLSSPKNINIVLAVQEERIQEVLDVVPPYVIKYVENGDLKFKGYIMDIWNVVAETLNISDDITEPKDSDWGTYKNGRWTGLVGQLIRREVDIAISDLTITYDRAKEVDFILPVIKSDTVDVIYKRFPSTEKSFFLLTNPFNNVVYALLASVLIGSVLFYVCILQLGQGIITSIPLVIRPGHLLDISWKFTCLLMRQDFNLNPSTCAGQVFLSWWWFFILLIAWIYSANLIAALSSSADLVKFSNLEELVNSDYDVGIYEAGVGLGLIRSSPIINVKSLYSKMVQSNQRDSRTFVNDETIHISRVMTERYAYVTYSSHAEMYLVQDCHLSLMGETLTGQELLTFATTKGSPLKSDVERVMYDLKESGLFDVWFEKWTSQHKPRHCIMNERIASITMREVKGGFVVVCVGVGFSVLVLGVEITYVCLKNRTMPSRRGVV